MIADHLSIIGLFFEELKRELTINQAAKLLGKSYAFTNKHIHELILAGILRKRVVGSAILCSLEYDNEETRGMLLLLSVRRKAQYLAEAETHRRQSITHYLAALHRPGIRTVYLTDTTLTVVREEHDAMDQREQPPSLKGMKVIVMEQQAFERAARRLDLSRTIILQNHEEFWSIIASIV